GAGLGGNDPAVDGFYVPGLVYYLGRWWWRGWYPGYRLRLIRKPKVRWGGVNPHEKVLLRGQADRLDGNLYHYTYEDISDHLQAINGLTEVAAREMALRGKSAGVARMLLHPFWRFLRFYFLRGGIRDGMPGFSWPPSRHSTCSSNMPRYGNVRPAIMTMDRLRILHVDPEKNWGGGESQVLGLTTYLNCAGHSSVVAADSDGSLYRRLTTTGLSVRPLLVLNYCDLLAGLRLRRLVTAGRYDLVHFHTARAHALSPWLHNTRVKRVVTRRMDYPVKKGWVTRLLYIHSVDAVVAISAGVHAALLAAEVPAARIRLIPSGVDTTRFTQDSDARVQIR